MFVLHFAPLSCVCLLSLVGINFARAEFLARTVNGNYSAATNSVHTPAQVRDQDHEGKKKVQTDQAEKAAAERKFGLLVAQAESCHRCALDLSYHYDGPSTSSNNSPSTSSNISSSSVAGYHKQQSQQSQQSQQPSQTPQQPPDAAVLAVREIHDRGLHARAMKGLGRH